ncbi:hypothetical protein ACFX2I_046896 [Malus domestica]
MPENTTKPAVLVTELSLELPLELPLPAVELGSDIDGWWDLEKGPPPINLLVPPSLQLLKDFFLERHVWNRYITTVLSHVKNGRTCENKLTCLLILSTRDIIIIVVYMCQCVIQVPIASWGHEGFAR